MNIKKTLIVFDTPRIKEEGLFPGTYKILGSTVLFPDDDIWSGEAYILDRPIFNPQRYPNLKLQHTNCFMIHRTVNNPDIFVIFCDHPNSFIKIL